MNCREAKRLLGIRLDRELDEARATAVTDHLQTCASCRAEEQLLQQASVVLRQEFVADTPADLAERAFQMAMTAEPVTSSFLGTLFPIAWPTALATSVAAVVLIGLSLTATPATAVEPIDQVMDAASVGQVQGVLQGALGISVDASSTEGTQ